MIHNSRIKSFHQILSLRLSNQYTSNTSIHYSSRSYCAMKVISYKKLLFPSYTQTCLSSNFIDIAKFSTDCNKMNEAGGEKSFIMSYEELLQAQKDDSVLIIDVREQKEIDETGKLPGSIHIPMKNVVNMLNLTDSQFEKEFGKSKPNKDTKIVLSCKSGMRSSAVQQELQKLGYHDAFNFVGGWSEWESKHKN